MERTAAAGTTYAIPAAQGDLMVNASTRLPTLDRAEYARASRYGLYRDSVGRVVIAVRPRSARAVEVAVIEDGGADKGGRA